MAKRQVFNVQYDRKAGGWKVEQQGGGTVARAETKASAVDEGRRIGNDILGAGGVAQLRIKGRDGRIQAEHTYGADPRRARG